MTNTNVISDTTASQSADSLLIDSSTIVHNSSNSSAPTMDATSKMRNYFSSFYNTVNQQLNVTIHDKAVQLQSIANTKLQQLSNTVHTMTSTATEHIIELADRLDNHLNQNFIGNNNSIPSHEQQDMFEHAFISVNGAQYKQALAFIDASCQFTIARNIAKLTLPDKQYVDDALNNIKQSKSNTNDKLSHASVFVALLSHIDAQFTRYTNQVISTYQQFEQLVSNSTDRSAGDELTIIEQCKQSEIDLCTYYVESIAQLIADILDDSSVIINELIDPHNNDIPTSCNARIRMSEIITADAAYLIDHVNKLLEQFSRATNRHIQLIVSITPSSHTNAFQATVQISQSIAIDIQSYNELAHKYLNLITSTLSSALTLLITDSAVTDLPIKRLAISIDTQHHEINSTNDTGPTTPHAIDPEQLSSSHAPSKADLLSSIQTMVTPIEQTDMFNQFK